MLDADEAKLTKTGTVTIFSDGTPTLERPGGGSCGVD